MKMTNRLASTLMATAAIIATVGLAWAEAEPNPTIDSVIQALISEASGGTQSDTVDTVKSSDASAAVTGIVTTFMANTDIVQQAVDRKANLIISHEPVFYNHRDETDWLEGDQAYKYKRQLLDQHGIVIWRFHDYLHSVDPDPVVAEVIQLLDWQQYRDGRRLVFTIPETNLESLISEVKRDLDIETLRFVGDPMMTVSRIGIMVGAPGGRRHISFLSKNDVDVLIVGEIAEWETSEYVRDANSAGRSLALIVTGHQPSEEPGMAWVAEWLSRKYPEIPVSHIPSPSPFSHR